MHDRGEKGPGLVHGNHATEEQRNFGSREYSGESATKHHGGEGRALVWLVHDRGEARGTGHNDDAEA